MFKQMRRKDREVTNENEIISIIDQCDVCKIAMIDKDKPYVVPMNFGYSVRNHIVTLYFHSANEGRKIDVLKINPNVCIEMDCGHKLLIGDTDCAYSMEYESLIGNGQVEFIESIAEKNFALTLIMKKYTSKDNFSFDEKAISRLTVFQIVLSDLVGKRLSK